MNLLHKNTRGFTLIELMIVIFVIGILVGVMLRVVNTQIAEDAVDDTIRAKAVNEIAQAAEAYRLVESSYPGDCDELIPDYIRECPVYIKYIYSVDSFTIFADTSAFRLFKYDSTWGKVMNCPEEDSDSDECLDL